MLVLSRKRDEDLVIGSGASQIVVRVVRIVGNRVTLGIEAPRTVRVRRGELANKPAAGPPSSDGKRKAS